MLTQNDQDYFTNRDNRMTTVDTARYTGYTLKALAQYWHVKQGPPFVKSGQRVYYDKRVLNKWLEVKPSFKPL